VVTESKPNSDDFKNVRNETSRYLRNKKSEYSKLKIKGLKTEGKTDLGACITRNLRIVCSLVLT
jgi:hypothetical protein